MTIQSSPFTTDPYAAPSASGVPVDGFSSGAVISAAMLESFRRTRGWVMFLTVLTFIGTAFCAIAAVGLCVVPIPQQPGSPLSGPMLGAIYAVLMVVYAGIAWSMLGYASALGHAADGADTATAERAMESGRKVWAMFGIVSIVTIVLCVVGGIALVVRVASTGVRATPAAESMQR